MFILSVIKPVYKRVIRNVLIGLAIIIMGGILEFASVHYSRNTLYRQPATGSSSTRR